MRDSFEICPKIQFLNILGEFWNWREVNFVKKSVKDSILACQGQSGKTPCLNLEIEQVSHLVLFFH